MWVGFGLKRPIHGSIALINDPSVGHPPSALPSPPPRRADRSPTGRPAPPATLRRPNVQPTGHPAVSRAAACAVYIIHW